MSMATFGEAVMVLREWAQAIREDWGSIDGRSCREELNLLADALIAANHQSGSMATVRQLRRATGLCPEGGAHWALYCDDGRDCKAQAENPFGGGDVMSDHVPDVWRVGRKVGRTVYVQAGVEPTDRDRLVGLMDTAELARRVVDAVNAAEAKP
jgi:predicted urease superfamily metal-dependent hydrolase